jgi:hypothetical protein
MPTTQALQQKSSRDCLSSTTTLPYWIKLPEKDLYPLEYCHILPELAENQEQMTISSDARERRIGRRWKDNIKINLKKGDFSL